MPIDGVFRADGYDLSKFGVGAIPRVPDGGVELERTNAILEQWLRILEPDGAPVGWGLRPPPDDQGYDVYIGQTIASMSRYNTSVIDGLDDAYQFNKGVAGGNSPPNRNTPDIAVLVDDPIKPTVKKVDAAIVGYPVGTYLAAKSIVGKGRRSHTRLTNFVEFTISDSEGPGKALEWQASQDLAKEAYGEGLWLSEPAGDGITVGNPDPSTIRLQAVRPKGGRTYTTRGPLKLGSHARQAPKMNETKVGKPKKLKWGQDIKMRGGLGHDLQPMRMKAGIVVTTPEGESRLSDVTDPVTVLKERKGHGIQFDPKHLHPSATGFKIFVQIDDVANPPWYQLIRTEKGDKFRRFAKINKPVLFGYIDTGEGKTNNPIMPAEPKPKMGATEVANNQGATSTTLVVKANASFPSFAPYDVKVGKEIMRVIAGAGTNTWTVRRAQLGTKMENHNQDDKVVEDDTAEKLRKQNEHQNRHFWLLAAADPTDEDTTGIEDPVGQDIDPPIPVGLGRPGAGTWYVAYSRRFDGKPTQASKPTKVVLPDIGAGATDKVIELQFPARVNKINNALYGQLNQKGLPTAWSFTKQDATAYTIKDAQIEVLPGQVKLRTSGSPVTNDRYPRAVSWDNGDLVNTLVPANRDRLERIRLTFEVSEYASGRGYVELAQYNNAGTAVGTITLATLTQNGFTYIDGTIGDASLSPTYALDPATDLVGIRWGIENGGSPNRNLKVSVYNLFWHPFDAHPRRFEDLARPDEVWEPSNDYSQPVPASNIVCITRAPDTPGDQAQAPTPLNTVLHSSGSVSVGAGTLPTGWAVYEGNPGSNSEATIATTTRFGSPTQNAGKFRSDGTQSINHNFFHRNYQSVWAGGNALALRFKLSIERLPTKSGRSVQIAAITGDDQAPLAWFQLWHDGTLELHTFNYEFYERKTIVTRNLRNGDLIDAELIVGGGNTNAGIASSYIGVNGQPRSAGAYISGVDWDPPSGVKTPRRVQYGGFQENQPDQAWTLWFDDVVVTYNGYAGTLAGTVVGATPMPDRPQKSGVYRATAPDGSVINQGYAFYLRSDVIQGVWMGHETDEFYVKPGVQRTAAVFMKPQDFPLGQRIFVLAAYNAEGDRVEIGCLSEQTGANAVANATPGWYEFWMAYTPPEGFFRLRWENEGTTGGTYVWQEPVDALGNLSTVALRDAARIEARAVTATFSVLLEARVPGQNGTNMENGWKEERRSIEASGRIPDELLALNPPAIAWRARSSDLENGPWTPYQTDEDLIPDLRYVDVEVTMRGDGISSPLVPAGGVSVLYSTYQPILLRENRTSVWGGALIGGDAESNLPRSINRHDYDTEAVGGIALARATTDRISRLSSYGVRVYTIEAEDEIAANMIAVDIDDIAQLTDWFIEDWYENLMQRIRFYAPGDFVEEAEFEFIERRQSELTGLRIPRVMTVEQTQVLEAHFLE